MPYQTVYKKIYDIVNTLNKQIICFFEVTKYLSKYNFIFNEKFFLVYFIIIKTIIIFNKITSGLINFRSRKQTNTNNNDDDNDMTPPCLMSYLTMTDNNPTHG